ncbi:MAG: hypothetical protein RL556_189 [Actinomycetota bacterium]
MFIIGLTGGIAAGKSSVAGHWVSLGAVEIDADQLAREAVAPGSEGLKQVVAHFGVEVLAGDQLDRQKLAQIVFSNPQKRLDLEEIVHPIVRSLAKNRLSLLSKDAIVVYNIPLLVESQSHIPFDVVVTVETPEHEQIRRMVELRNQSVEQAKSRIRAQSSPTSRAAHADYILNSNQSLDLLLKDAGALWFKFETLANKKQREHSSNAEGSI